MGNWKNKFIAKRPASCSPLKAMYNEGGPGGPGDKTKSTSTRNPDGSITLTSTTTSPGTPGKPPPGLPTVETQWDKNANDVQSKFETIDDFRIYVDKYNEKKYGKKPTTSTESITYQRVKPRPIDPMTSTPGKLQIEKITPNNGDGDGGNGKGEGKKEKKKKTKKNLFKNRKKKVRVRKKKTKPQHSTKPSTACVFGQKC